MPQVLQSWWPSEACRSRPLAKSRGRQMEVASRIRVKLQGSRRLEWKSMGPTRKWSTNGWLSICSCTRHLEGTRISRKWPQSSICGQSFSSDHDRGSIMIYPTESKKISSKIWIWVFLWSISISLYNSLYHFIPISIIDLYVYPSVSGSMYQMYICDFYIIHTQYRYRIYEYIYITSCKHHNYAKYHTLSVDLFVWPDFVDPFPDKNPWSPGHLKRLRPPACPLRRVQICRTFSCARRDGGKLVANGSNIGGFHSHGGYPEMDGLWLMENPS